MIENFLSSVFVNLPKSSTVCTDIQIEVSADLLTFSYDSHHIALSLHTLVHMFQLHQKLPGQFVYVAL